MSLFAGDLTTPTLAVEWAGTGDPASPAIALMVSSQSRAILSKLNRIRLYSQLVSRTLDGVGTYQMLLPDYPVTSLVSVQVGNAIIPQANLPPAPGNFALPVSTFGYGIRFTPWGGDLPGEASMLEFVNGYFPYGAQNVIVKYNAGYLVSAEADSVPAAGPYTITVQQPQGIWCRDNGVTYASTGVALTPVTTLTGVAGQYTIGPDDTPGLYTFNAADASAALLFNYSFVPADLTDACNQMVAERLSYRGRIGQISKSLGGQETIKFMRGGGAYYPGKVFPDLPPEVAGAIWPYVSVTPPAIGAPV